MLFEINRYDPEQESETNDKLSRLKKLNKRKSVPQPETQEEPKKIKSLPTPPDTDSDQEVSELQSALKTQLELPSDNHYKRKLKRKSVLVKNAVTIPDLGDEIDDDSIKCLRLVDFILKFFF